MSCIALIQRCDYSRVDLKADYPLLKLAEDCPVCAITSGPSIPLGYHRTTTIRSASEVRRNGCQLYQEQLMMGVWPDGTKKYPSVVDETSSCPICASPGQFDVFVAQHPHQPLGNAAPIGQSTPLHPKRDYICLTI